VLGGDPIGSTCRSIGLTGEVRQGAERTTSECDAVSHPVLTVECGREFLRYNLYPQSSHPEARLAASSSTLLKGTRHVIP
jgi:hypothetical protein